MSNIEMGKVYFPKNEGCRIEKDEDSEEDENDGKKKKKKKKGKSKDPKKLKKRRESHGGRSFVLDKTKGERGEYKEV